MSSKNTQNSHSASFAIRTSEKAQMIDITDKVSGIVAHSGIRDGICHLYVPHTTAAVTINENADPDVVSDMLMGLDHIVGETLAYRHSEGNSPAHIKSSIIGTHEQVFIENGALSLGTWQGIFFCEFDGPRSRRILIKIA